MIEIGISFSNERYITMLRSPFEENPRINVYPKDGENPMVISRLVDAAPDLLEACKLALDDVIFFESRARSDGFSYSELIHKLRSAIAKAELIESNS